MPPLSDSVPAVWVTVPVLVRVLLPRVTLPLTVSAPVFVTPPLPWIAPPDQVVDTTRVTAPLAVKVPPLSRSAPAPVNDVPEKLAVPLGFSVAPLATDQLPPVFVPLPVRARVPVW